jgi:hypothetical protein
MKARIYLTKVSLKILSITVHIFAIKLTLILSPPLSPLSTTKFIKTRTLNMVRKNAAGFSGMKRKAFLLLREGHINLLAPEFYI